MKYRALSIVYPSGSKIAAGEIDPDGQAVALVKIKNVRPYLESDIPLACASRWEPGYYSWELTDIRP